MHVPGESRIFCTYIFPALLSFVKYEDFDTQEGYSLKKIYTYMKKIVKVFDCAFEFLLLLKISFVFDPKERF